MLKMIRKLISNHGYTILGVIIGLYISSFLQGKPQQLCSNNLKSLQENETLRDQRPSMVHVPKKTSTLPKKAKLIRPRYYSTELGIREKLFVGIFTSEEKISTLALPLNKTLNHLVDQTKFFITAQYKLKAKFNLSGIVGFTDTRGKYRPFQVLKYIGDNFAQMYDYYFLANDYTYMNAHKLNDLVKKISVSMDVYLGQRVVDGSYCNLDAGILLSNSVIRAVREHLDWCVINAISEDNSENIGRCVYHSIGLSCQEMLQEQTLTTFKLKHFEFTQNLVNLSKREDFNNAITIHPILQGENYYLLDAYFLKVCIYSSFKTSSLYCLI